MKSIPALLLYFTLIVFIVGCSNQFENNDESIASPSHENVNIDKIKLINDTNEVKCKCDITHDGIEDEIVVYFGRTIRDSNQCISLSIFDAGRSLIWERELSLAHDGWGSYYIFEQNGKAELLYYFREERQGKYDADFKLFHVGYGFDKKKIEEYIVDESSGSYEQENAPGALLFDKRTSEYINKSTLLISTYGGELKYYCVD